MSNLQVIYPSWAVDGFKMNGTAADAEYVYGELS